MGFALSKLAAFARGRNVPVADEGAPMIRRADAHPDAPARAPIFASRDFNGLDIFARPESGRRRLVAHAEPGHETASPWAGYAMPSAPEPLPAEDLPAFAPPAFAAPAFLTPVGQRPSEPSPVAPIALARAPFAPPEDAAFEPWSDGEDDVAAEQPEPVADVFAPEPEAQAEQVTTHAPLDLEAPLIDPAEGMPLVEEPPFSATTGDPVFVETPMDPPVDVVAVAAPAPAPAAVDRMATPMALPKPRSMEGMSLAELAERLERGLTERRRQIGPASNPRVIADMPVAPAVPVRDMVAQDVDDALRAALGTLRTMTARPR